MRKWLALVQVPFIAMMWVACSSDDGGQNDSGGDVTTQDVKLDKKVIPDVGQQETAPTCAPSDVAASDLTWTPPRTPAPFACSSQQIDDYFTNCLPGSGTSCSTYEAITANQPCLMCLLSTEGKDTAFGPLIAVPNNVVYANTGGCIAIETNDLTATGCGAKAWLASQCEDLACSNNCVGATFAEYQSCTGAAQTGTCKPEEDAVCNLADAGSVAACNLNAGTFQALYTSLAKVFCGGYAPDAGPPSDGGTTDSGTTDSASDAPVDAPPG